MSLLPLIHQAVPYNVTVPFTWNFFSFSVADFTQEVQSLISLSDVNFSNDS